MLVAQVLPAHADVWDVHGPPTVRFGAAATVDVRRSRWIVVGGYDGRLRADVLSYALDGTYLSARVSTQGPAPEPCSFASAVYDSLNDRVVVFGGQGENVPFSGLWTLDFSVDPARWTAVTPVGPAPAARSGHTAVVDDAHRRMLVFGGRLANGSTTHETWSLDLDSLVWAPVDASGPPPSRTEHAAVYDVDRGRMVVVGGVSAPTSGTNTTLADVWALTSSPLPAWTPMVPTNTTAARQGHAAVLDRSRDRVVVIGGFTMGVAVEALNLADPPSWERVLTSNEFTKHQAAVACIDRPRNQVLVLGGSPGGLWINELAALDLAEPWRWSVVWPTTMPWRARVGHTAILDPLHDRMVVYGGGSASYSKSSLQDVWTLSLDDPAQRAVLWPSTDASPDSFVDPRAVYDPARRRMIVIGTVVGPFGTPPHHQLWSFDLEHGNGWARLPVTGRRPAGWWMAAAVHDPMRDRVIVVGRAADLSAHGVWTLALDGPPVWTRMTIAGESPTDRVEHAMVYDPVRDRVLLFGGDSYGWTADLWALDLAGVPAWQRLMPSPPTRPRRGLVSASMVFDPLRDRLVVFGGRDDPWFQYGALMDTTAWELPLNSGALEWRALTPSGPTPTGRHKATAVFDPGRDRIVFFGGSNLAQQLADVLVLSFGGTTDASNDLPRRRSMTARPNPSSGLTHFSFSLASRGRARLGVYDLLGRRVATLVDADLPGGVHAAVWNGRDATGARVPSGVYLADLQAGGERRTCRIVRVR